MTTIPLGAAPAHVGQSVCFIAAVQQIATGKRVLVAHRRVQVCHVLHVGDASRQYFKVTCWGETQPTLLHLTSSLEDADPMQLSSVDATLQIGDIVLFSFCYIKSFWGNVEAQFILHKDESATSSTVQLLYRRDRYFSTQDVLLKDLYPMIDWYKKHCREFTMENGVSSMERKSKVKIKDLKDNMVACVVCKLRPLSESSEQVFDKKGAVTSELDGVLLCEFIMFDSPRDVMTLNLWDHHADKRFVARILDHRGAFEIDGIVVSLQALSNRLVANTTPHTVFRFLEPDDLETIELEKKLQRFEKPVQAITHQCGPTTFATMEELDGCSFEGHAILENVRVEQVCLDRFFGSNSSVLPKFAPHLAEMYCDGCDRTLPELPARDKSALRRFGDCASKCKTRRNGTVNAHCSWRYRCFPMILRDSRNEQFKVEAVDPAIVELVGNIKAQVLAESTHSKDQGNNLCRFDAASAVASLLNALVDDANQKFTAQIFCSSIIVRDIASQLTDSYHDTSHDDSYSIKRLFRLISLTPSDTYLI